MVFAIFFCVDKKKSFSRARLSELSVMSFDQISFTAAKFFAFMKRPMAFL
jgi:hypothetical protein